DGKLGREFVQVCKDGGEITQGVGVAHVVAREVVRSDSADAGRNEAEGRVLSVRPAGVGVNPEFEELMSYELPRVIERFERNPGPVGQSFSDPESGILSKEVRAVELVELDARELMPQVIAGIVDRLERNPIPCQTRN